MQSFIPFMIQESENEIPEEIEVASILLIAMSRQENEHPDTMVKANYPFKIFESEEGKIVFDLLGLIETEKKWLLPNDLSPLLDELEAVENSDKILGLLYKGKDLLDKEPQFGSTRITGLIEQEDVKVYLLGNAKNVEEEIKLELFEPTLTSRKFSYVKKNVKSIQKEIEENIMVIGQVKGRIETLHDTIKKAQEKQYSAVKMESEIRLDIFNEERETAVKIIENALKKETKTIKTEFKERLSQKTRETELIKEEITHLEKKLESGLEGDAKRELANLKKMLPRHNKDIQALEGEHERIMEKVEMKAETEKQQWEEKLLFKKIEEETLLRKLLETHDNTLRGCIELKNRISEEEATLMNNSESLTKILDIKYYKGKELSMPFYIFGYGEGNIGFYPPAKISEEKSMRKRLKLIISSNLGNKIDQFISPQTDSFDEILEMVVDSLKDETKLSIQYANALPEVNLLESRETLDKMVVGLYQIMEWGWISEKDYIKVQRFLVEKLDFLNGGNIFQKVQEIEETPEALEAEEITDTE